MYGLHISLRIYNVVSQQNTHSRTLYTFTEILTASGGHATTTVYVEATRNGRHPIGILTSTVDKFINAGTTTEYMTQHVGTYLDDKYAKVESTNTREYYRVISPTKSVEFGGGHNPAASTKKPTGMVASSVSYDVNGRQTTEYTVEQFRTYIDGHYAHLISSVSKVYSDPPIISATPVYDPSGLHHSRSPKILPDRPEEGTIPTQTIGSKYAKKYEQRLKLDDLFDEALREAADDDVAENAIRVRSIEDGAAPRPSPVEKSKALPTFTVASDGEINIPSIEAIEEENEIEPTATHRFEPQKPSATRPAALDSVTYIGFVDFTTTIDDTVVIFRPKKTFSTTQRNIFIPKIEPTQSVERINPFKPSVAPTPQLKSNREEAAAAGDDDDDQKEEPRRSGGESGSSDPELKNRINGITRASITAGINPLKSLLAASASRRNKFGGFSKSSIANQEASAKVEATKAKPSILSSKNIKPSAPSGFGGRPRITLVQRNFNPTIPGLESSVNKDAAPEVNDLSSSINPDSDVELVYKTLYTTYTYFTTFFRASTTRVKSREEVISNVVTLTNILGPSDLAKLKSSCEVDATCQFISSTAPADFTNGFIGRPNTKAVIDEEPRRSSPGDQDIDQEVNGVFKTFFTTYTYFTTLFVDGSSSISTRTEVYSNVQSSGVPVPATDVPTFESTRAAALIEQASSRRANSPRRLEYSSIARPDLNNDEKPEKLRDLVVIPAASAVEPSKPNEDEDELEVQLADENQIDASSVAPSAVKTFYTTYTYFTTLFRNGTSYVTSNLETVTNTADATASPTLVQPSVTFYTTFTYWTTSIDGDKTIITSREETKTDILAATVTDSLQILPTSVGIGIDATEEPKSGLSSSVDSLEDIVFTDDSFETTTVPELESSEVEANGLASSSATVTPSLTSSADVVSSSLDFNDIDDDFTLASSSLIDSSDVSSSSASEVDADTTSSSSEVKSSSARTSAAFTPVIRPNLFGRTRLRPNNRIRSRSRSTTVAIITRSDVTPTLIATPVSSLLQTSSPAFSSSRSRNLNSASILNRGRQSSSSILASSSINPSRASSLSSLAISSSSVTSGSSDIEPTPSTSASSTSEEPENKPNIIAGLRLRRPDPFRARLKERQRQRLEQIRSQNDDSDNEDVEEQEEKKSTSSTPSRFSKKPPSFSLPSLGGGARAPIFVSSRTENFRRPTPESTSAEISLPPSVASRRERARQRINALFRRREPSFLRPRPSALSNDNGDLQSEASTRRRKRQVSTYDNYGTRIRARQSYIRKHRSSDAQNSYSTYQSPSSYSSYSNPYTSTYTSYGGSGLSTSSSYNDPYDSTYSSSSSAYSKPSSSSNISNANKSRRLVRQNTASRSRSRFRSRTRDSTTTTTTSRPSFSRFRPRTVSTRGSTSNRFTTGGRRPGGSLFDYDEYDYGDYDYDVDLQSSQNAVPDAITATHSVPFMTKIPVFENGRNGLRDILTTSPSLEVIAVTALKSTNIDGSPIIYANAHTNTPALGTQVLTFEALRATETTAIEFTPTRIRGLRTSFSHAVPSTIYNIRPVTTSIVQEVDSNQLLSSLLLQLLGGQQPGKNPLAAQSPAQAPNLNNPLLGQAGLGAGAGAGGLNPTPATRFVTHTSSYVTTLTNVDSTVLPITLRGRLIKTTLVESKTEVVTATELSTETIIAPTSTAGAFGLLGLGAAQPTANPLGGLLGADLQQQLLVAQLQQQLQQQQQQIVNQKILSQVNLDQEGAINVEQTQAPDPEPAVLAPSTSLVTIFVSGSKPGDFTRITSTVTLSAGDSDSEGGNERFKRDLSMLELQLRPSPVLPVQKTAMPDLLEKESSSSSTPSLSSSSSSLSSSNEYLISSSLIEPSMQGLVTDSDSHFRATTTLRLNNFP